MSTPVRTSRAAPAPASSSGGLSARAQREFALDHLKEDLRALGFLQDPWPFPAPGLNPSLSLDERAALLQTESLFAHADHQAGREVLLFLLATTDVDRARRQFRDCWPVLDKKQEADFRRAVLSWYREMSDLHPDRLPFLNAALLQTPGGRKFQAFLHILSSHVVRTRVAQLAKKVGEEEHCLLRHSKEGCQRTQSLVFATSARASLKSAGEEDVRAASVLARAKTLAEKELAEDYRAVREKRRKAELECSERLGNDETLDSLERAAAELNEESARLANQCGRPMDKLLSSLRTVHEIVKDPPGNAAANVVGMGDLVEGGFCRKEEPFASVFARLLAGVVEGGVIPGERAPEVPQVRKTSARVAAQLRGLKEKAEQLRTTTLPEARSRVERLWEGQQARGEAVAVTLPPVSPFVHISFATEKGEAERFSLLPRRNRQRQQEEQAAFASAPTAAHARQAAAVDESAFSAFLPSFQITSVASAPSPVHGNASSTLSLSPSTSSVKYRNVAYSSAFAPITDSSGCSSSHRDVSKMSSTSVFSPILSSSRVADKTLEVSAASDADRTFCGASLAALSARVNAIKSRNATMAAPAPSPPSHRVNPPGIITDRSMSSTCSSSPPSPPLGILKNRAAAVQKVLDRLHLDSPALEELESPDAHVLVGSETPKAAPRSDASVAEASTPVWKMPMAPSSIRKTPRFKLHSPLVSDSPEEENRHEAASPGSFSSSPTGRPSRPPLLDLEQQRGSANMESAKKKKKRKSLSSEEKKVSNRLEDLMSMLGEGGEKDGKEEEEEDAFDLHMIDTNI